MMVSSVSVLIIFILNDIVSSQTDVELHSLSATYNLPTFSYGGLSAFYDNKLYSINGRNCTANNVCKNNAVPSSYSLDLSSGITFNSANRKLMTINNNPSWTETVFQTAHLSESGTTSGIAGTASSTYINGYAWSVYPGCCIASTTNYIMKFDLINSQYITTNISDHDYFDRISGPSLIDACVTNDGDTNLYVIGGQNNNSIKVNNVYKLDIINNKWLPLPNISIAIKGSSCVYLKDKLYVLGGVNTSNHKIRTIQIYNEVSDEWSIAPVKLKCDRHRSISYIHPNQRWIVTIGGRNNQNGGCPTEYYQIDNHLVVATSNVYYNKQFFSAMWQYDVNISIIFLYGGSINNTVFNDVSYMILHHDDVIDGLTTITPTVTTNYPLTTETQRVLLTVPWNGTVTPSIQPSNAPTIAPSTGRDICIFHVLHVLHVLLCTNVQNKKHCKNILKSLHVLVMYLNLIIYSAKCAADLLVINGAHHVYADYPRWSPSYLSFSIVIENNNMHSILDITKLTTNCSEIFDVYTMDPIYKGIGYDALCTWIKQKINDIEYIILKVTPSSTSLYGIHSITNTFVDEQPTMLPLTIHYVCDNNEGIYQLGTQWLDLHLASYDAPPNIVISSSFSQIGVCDDLILDATSTTGLGGRNNAIFEWNVTNIEQQNQILYNESYVVIKNNLLGKGNTYKISLTVTNWYKKTATTEYFVYVANTVIPIVSLNGISSVSSTNTNEFVNIYTNIEFNNHCEIKDNQLMQLMYNVKWSVNVTQNYVDVDSEKLAALNTYLSDLEEMDSLSIDRNNYLQNGLSYSFNMNLKCIGSYNCDIDTVHILDFVYSDIECDITPNNIILNDVDPNIDFEGVELELNGKLFTYDPNGENDKDFSYQWICINTVLSESCRYLLDSDYNGIVYVDLERYNFEYSSSYSFEFTLTVKDNSNPNRTECVTKSVIQINTADNAGMDKKLLIVTATGMEHEINKNERVRMLGNIINYEIYQLLQDGSLYYEWVELNGLLNTDKINEHRQTLHDNSLNLILSENVLESRQIYSFQLIVSQYSDDNKLNLIGYGESAPVSISVLSEPIILTNSFQIKPDCNAQYDSISELLSIKHSLSISADSEYGPLSYQFGYIDDNNYYFNSFAIYDSFESNIYLPPIGQFEIFANIIDSKSSIINESVQCSITLASYSECIDFEDDIILFMTNNSAVSVSQQYSFIFQQTNTYLQYLYKYDENDDCIENSLDQILWSLNEYVVTSSISLCNTYYPITLSQIMMLWMDLVTTKHELIIAFYVDSYSDLDDLDLIITENSNSLLKLKKLIYGILDPCSFINDLQIVKQFTVSTDSIITQIPKIYYKKNDITSNLSPIIVDPNYHHLLHEITESIIDLIKHIPYHHSIDLYNLISSALYISELIRVSLSISGELSFTDFDGFSIYSLRVHDEYINTSLHNIFVYIPDDITKTKTETTTEIFDYVDIFMIGINTSSSNNISMSSDYINDNCSDHKGDLSSDSISIRILGNNTNTTHLPSNINFTFSCDINIGCDASFKCVWYNETNDIWQTDGCNTIINTDNSEITCSCSHLTTFATIHNIHSSECEIKENDFINDWLESEEWDYINWIFGGIFGVIFFYSAFEVFPFCRTRKLKWYTHRAVWVMILIGITSLLYFLVSILAYYTKQSFMENNDKYNSIIFTEMYTLSLLLPQITCFMIFTLIFYTWFVIAHSFKNAIEEYKGLLRKVLYSINIFVWIILITYYILLLAVPFNESIFIFGAWIWSATLIIVCLSSFIYAFLSGRVLFKAAKYTRNQSFGDQDMQIARRLLIINTIITFYFMFSCSTTIYFALYPLKLSINNTYFSLSCGILFLFCVCWMHRSAMHKLIKMEKEESKSKQSRQNSKNDESLSKTANNKSRSVFTKLFSLRLSMNGGHNKSATHSTKESSHCDINNPSPQSSNSHPNTPKGKKNQSKFICDIDTSPQSSNSHPNSPKLNSLNSPKNMTPNSPPLTPLSDASTPSSIQSPQSPHQLLARYRNFTASASLSPHGPNPSNPSNNYVPSETAEFQRISSASLNPINESIECIATKQNNNGKRVTFQLDLETEDLSQKKRVTLQSDVSEPPSLCGSHISNSTGMDQNEQYINDGSIILVNDQSLTSRNHSIEMQITNNPNESEVDLYDDQNEGKEGNETKTKKQRDSLLDNNGTFEIFEAEIRKNGNGDNGDNKVEEGDDDKYEFVTINDDETRWNTPGLHYFTGEDE